MRSSVALLLLAVGWVIACHASRPYAVALATLPGFVALIGALGEQQNYGARATPSLGGSRGPLWSGSGSGRSPSIWSTFW